ncbi:GapA-binding peptide SR1P [Sutcliffiella cohnii]|uniref:Phosphoesterase n=1 Tax=Sutcliffiella cohnii TaxID=33932 RepID=A0A223KRU1_9BACI|nr:MULTISPECIES: GapA-binding peptide SR1P [Sutcliffiella]AST92205.1 phosphoesterase [Sutcliffiella cohnii]MED4015495.1 GapA-binding peptide SR1P [Sutcliffiella cohnii]WBL13437.1 GapA-binding peptide SR1P [Sutcliffiella sp. NC1]
MGTIVCQTCQATLEYFETEKVSTLYAKCSSCKCTSKEEKK